MQGEENGKGKGKDKQPKVGLTVELDREKVAGRQGATLEDVLRGESEAALIFSQGIVIKVSDHDEKLCAGRYQKEHCAK